MPDIDARIEEIELQIMEIDEKYKRTRNTIEKATFSSKMEDLRREIGKLRESQVEVKDAIINEIPIVADHVDKPTRVERQITDNGSTFTTLL